MARTIVVPATDGKKGALQLLRTLKKLDLMDQPRERLRDVVQDALLSFAQLDQAAAIGFAGVLTEYLATTVSGCVWNLDELEDAISAGEVAQ